MPYAEQPILTISIAAKLLHVHPRTIMLYERAGVFNSQRTDTKRRMFSIQDLDHLQFIKYLTQVKGINLLGVKVVLEALTAAGKEGIDLKKQLFPQFKAEKLV